MEATNVDIFQVGRSLGSKYPELLARLDDDALAAIDLAVENTYLLAQRLATELLPRIAALSPGDYDRLLDLVTDLREDLAHSRKHVEAAVTALWSLTDEVVQHWPAAPRGAMKRALALVMAAERARTPFPF